MNSTQAQAIKPLLSGTREEIKKAVEFLYRTQRSKLFHELADYCTPVELEEIFDDALLVLLKKITIVKGCPISYFRKICRNKALDRFRLNNRKRVVTTQESELDNLIEQSTGFWKREAEMNPEQAFSKATTLLMHKIGEENRKVLIQRYLHNLSNQEIAEEQGINTQSVTNKIYRSIQKMRTILEHEPWLKETLEAQLYEAF